MHTGEYADVDAREVRPGDMLLNHAGYTVARVIRHRDGRVTVWTIGGIRLAFAAGDRVWVTR